jgi:hypothetical protein
VNDPVAVARTNDERQARGENEGQFAGVLTIGTLRRPRGDETSRLGIG